MRTLIRYIKEAEEKQDNLNKYKKDVLFTIWEAPDKKVSQLKSNEEYLKIEYTFEDTKKNIQIDFLLGYIKMEDTWKLWIGKVGAVSYDDDPYCDLKTDNFGKAINASLDKIADYIQQVYDDKHKYIQYYIGQ